MNIPTKLKDKKVIFQILMVSFLLLPLVFLSINPISIEEIHEQLNHEKIICGNITNINQYTEGSFFSTSTIWVIEIDNDTTIKSRKFNEPYLLSVGDYIQATLYNTTFSENYASDIELLGAS